LAGAAPPRRAKASALSGSFRRDLRDRRQRAGAASRMVFYLIRRRARSTTFQRLGAAGLTSLANSAARQRLNVMRRTADLATSPRDG
jgi:hypothetical protein